jgi:branched-chain amino acid transport system permease protein
MNWTSLTYGPGGFRAPTLNLGFGLDNNRSIFLVALAAAAALAIFTDNLLRSRFGRAFIAIRDNPQAAASMGVDVTMTKTIAFALSAAFAGLAGALSSALLGFVSPESYSLDQMVMIQIMVVLGGLGSLVGSLIGPVLVLSLLETLRDTGGFMEVAFGALLIVAVLFQPKGIAGFLRRGGSQAAFMPRALKSRAGDGA